MNDQQLTAERAAFEKWAEEYGLIYEPNYSVLTKEDCFAAWQAALAQRELGTGNPVRAAYEAWRKGTRFSGDPSYTFECIDKVTYAYFERRVYGDAGIAQREPVAEVYYGHYGGRTRGIGFVSVRPIVSADKLPPPGTKLYAGLSPIQSSGPVAEGEVADVLEFLRESGKENDWRSTCLLSCENIRTVADLLEKTEAARLAAEQVLSMEEMKSAGYRFELEEVQSQLTAERARSAALVEAITWATQNLRFHHYANILDRLNATIAAYQSSKDGL